MKKIRKNRVCRIVNIFITFFLISSFLYSETAFAFSGLSETKKSYLQINSAFDQDPRNEEWRTEILERLKRMTGETGAVNPNDYILVEGVEDSEYIALPLDKIQPKEGEGFYRVKEGQTIVNKYSTEAPYIYTFGLVTCAAVTLYDPKTKTGLMSHTLLTKPFSQNAPALDMERYVLFLVNKFLGAGGTLNDLEITVVWGRDRDRHEISRMTELVIFLKRLKHKKFKIDASKTEILRGACINLNNGEAGIVAMRGRWKNAVPYNGCVNKEAGASLAKELKRQVYRTAVHHDELSKRQIIEQIVNEAREFIEKHKQRFWQKGLRITTCFGHAIEAQRRLLKKGINSKIFYYIRGAIYHAWAQTDDGWVIDGYTVNPEGGIYIERINEAFTNEYKGDDVFCLEEQDKMRMQEDRQKWIEEARRIESELGIARHELAHIQGKGHQNDEGMRIVRGIAKSERDKSNLPETQVKHTKILLNGLLPAKLGDRIYEIRYGARRLSESQQEVVKAYIELLKSKVSNPNNIIAVPFMDDGRDYIFKILCKRNNRDVIGEGRVGIDTEGELGSYPLCVIGMLNIAFAASNIPNNMEGECPEKYIPLIQFIRNQYAEITGEKLELPNITAEGLFDALRNIKLPEPQKVDLDTAEELDHLAKQLLASA